VAGGCGARAERRRLEGGERRGWRLRLGAGGWRGARRTAGARAARGASGHWSGGLVGVRRRAAPSGTRWRVGAGGDSTTSQQSAQEVAEPRAEGMENKGSEFAAFGAQEDGKSVTDMLSQEGQLEEVPDNFVEGNGPSLRGGRKERIRESLERKRRCTGSQARERVHGKRRADA
jgi:hypothetical protein